jgi:hypothetical protein
MRGTTALENVISNVHTMSANYHDQTVAILDMDFDSAERMWISGQPIEVLPSAQRLITNRLRVPYSYLTRCPANLQAQNLNYWLEKEQQNRKTLFCRFDDNKLRAVFTDRYEPLDHMEVLSKMLEYGFTPQQEVRYALDDEILTVSVPDYNRAFTVLNKDKLVPGICISNSEVGILSLSIKAYYLRLVCSNGLIDKTSVDAKYKHISRKGLDNFPSVLQDVIHQSHQGENRFLISTQTPVNNPIASIETFARQFNLAQEETEIVKQAYYQEEGGTMFCIINAFTRGAQTPSLPISVAHQMENIGGAILAMVRR